MYKNIIFDLGGVVVDFKPREFLLERFYNEEIEQKVFEPLYGRMLISGARSGQADTVLARLSQLFTQDAQAAMDALIDSIEPILAAFLTLAVGVTLLAVMLPLIGILGSIG